MDEARKDAERFRQRWHEALEDGERFRREAHGLRAERDAAGVVAQANLNEVGRLTRDLDAAVVCGDQWKSDAHEAEREAQELRGKLEAVQRTERQARLSAGMYRAKAVTVHEALRAAYASLDEARDEVRELRAERDGITPEAFQEGGDDG